MPNRERLTKRAVCWLPTCSAEVTFIVEQADYGEIIGFCRKHRPTLLTRVAEVWAAEEPAP